MVSVTTRNGDSLAQNVYAYNRRRLPVSEAISQPGYEWSLGYAYDRNGALAQLTYPSNLVVDYAPNALGQATQAGVFASGVVYHPNGAIRQFTYGNGVVHTMEQDARGLPKRVVDAMVQDRAYSYDAQGNVAQIIDHLDATGTRVMAYDGKDRLLSVASTSFGGNGEVQFSYDVLDNLRASSLPGVRDQTYWYDVKNRLTSITDGTATVHAMEYDVQGNLSDRDGQLFEFDKGNRLRTVHGRETYRYDAHGRRIQASGATGDILSMYSQDGVLRYQDDRRQSTKVAYVTLGGSLIAQIRDVAAPAVPALTVPTYSPDGNYTVSWNTGDGTIRYELQELSGLSDWATIYEGQETHYLLSGRASGSYTYRIRACANACSNWSASETTDVELPPSSSPVLSAPSQAPNGDYIVSWTPLASVSRYVLDEDADSAGWVSVQDGAGVTRAYTTKPAGSYAYRVRACNVAGCGPVSNEVTVRAYYAPAAPNPSAPAWNTSGSYVVGWPAVAGTLSYRVEESSNGAPWTQMPELAATNVALSGKTSGSYRYRVRACNGAGCSDYSAEIATSVLLIPAAAPWLSVPASSGSGAYMASWSGVADASSYQLQEQLNGGGWAMVHDSAATGWSTSGRGNGSYGYIVRGCNASGCGPWSAVSTVVVSLPPPIPQTPSGLEGSVTYDNSIRPPVKETTLWWNASAGATYYELWQGSTPTTLMYTGGSTGYYDLRKDTRSFWVRACNVSGCSGWAGPKTL